MKRYDENFKIEALKLSDEIGVKKACEQLNVNYGTLAGWRQQRVKKTKVRTSTDADIHKENNRLKKEIAELKSANEILKDALGFFVQDRKKQKRMGFSLTSTTVLLKSSFQHGCCARLFRSVKAVFINGSETEKRWKHGRNCSLKCMRFLKRMKKTKTMG